MILVCSIPPWNEMEEYERNHTLRCAYEYKRFMECNQHRWELDINFGTVAIYCSNCMGDYAHVEPNYANDICFNTTLYKIEWSGDELLAQ